MEYFDAIFPILFSFRLIGFDLHPCPSKPLSFWRFCHLISLKSLKIFNFGVQSASVFYVLILLRNSKTLFSTKMFFIRIAISTMTIVTTRFFLGRKFRRLINLVEEMNTFFNQLEGKDQLFLKKLNWFCKFVFLFQIFVPMNHLIPRIIFDQTWQIDDITLKETAYNDFKLLVIFIIYLAYPVHYFFMSVVTSIYLVQLIVHIFIFRLLGSDYFSADCHPVDIKKQLIKFIQFHRKQCRLLEMTNDVFALILLLEVLQNIFNLIFLYSAIRQFQISMLVTSMITMFLLISVPIILAGITNRLVYKSLEHCRKFVVGSRLSVKVELYEIYVKLKNPGIEFGGITTFEPKAIILVLDIVGTYFALMHQKTS
ncbi:hypothetical protein CHUAL_014090 [Chamberlinius hualienensis]